MFFGNIKSPYNFVKGELRCPCAKAQDSLSLQEKNIHKVEHLALEVFDLVGTGSQFANLQNDASITINETSEVFGTGEVWSFTFTLNIPANAHLFGTGGEIHGSRLHELIHHRRTRLWSEGIPLYDGYLRLDDEVQADADGNIELSFESGNKTFTEKIEGAKANQVPLMSNVPIGVALWRKRLVSYEVKLSAKAIFTNNTTSNTDNQTNVKNELNDSEVVRIFNKEDEDTPVQAYPRMVFPKGTFKRVDDGEEVHIDYVNTDSPYDDGHPYCNLALCYQRYGYERKSADGSIRPDYSSEPEAQRGYEVMPADRLNSAPNFFVIYWINSLMKHLGIHIELNEMEDIQDLRRLFFVNTLCAYKEPDHRLFGDEDMVRYRFADGVRLIPEQFNLKKSINIDESSFDATWETMNVTYNKTYISPSEIPTIDHVSVKVKEVVTDNEDSVRSIYMNSNSYLHDAYATSECFPNVDISEVISALENGFGIRFLFSRDYQRVRIVLLRNLFRSDAVQTLDCDIIGEVKVENSVRGFRMTYGDSDDTHFYYKGFADMLHHKAEIWADESDKHDYSRWQLDADYSDILHKISAFEKTCYVTPNTGNAYGIKVDQNAKRYDELHASLLEYAGFMDAEDGDCTGEESTIKTINVGFKPAIMNDLNMEEERKNGVREQRFALFCDDKMRARRPDLQEDGKDYNDPSVYYDTSIMYSKFGPKGSVSNMTHDDGIVAPGEFAINSDMYATRTNLKAEVRRYIKDIDLLDEGKTVAAYATYELRGLTIQGHINEGYRLYLQDNFEPNDDGVSPIEKHEWGLTLGIMRGSGSDAYVRYSDDPDDDEGNDTWSIVSGSSVTAHPDTCDCYGKEWDYSPLVPSGSSVLEQMSSLWPNSNIDLLHASGSTYRNQDTYIRQYYIKDSRNERDERVYLLFATSLGPTGDTRLLPGSASEYGSQFKGMSEDACFALDRRQYSILIAIYHSFSEAESQGDRLLELQKRAFVDGDASTVMEGDDNDIGSRYGRISLKLRAEKPNPQFDPKQPEDDTNRRYLSVEDPNLRYRGLADQFYKEYSYWVRNSRIDVFTVKMELAQLLSIDKTVRVRVGDVIGFIYKIRYSISRESGLGLVTMEIMYI